MSNVTYYVVAPFTRDDDGMIVPGEAKESPNGELAMRRARGVAASPDNIGALAFSRTGDPNTGEFQEGVVLASFGEVDIQALQG